MTSALSLLRDLVQIPSVSSLSNRPLVEYARRFLHESRWQTRPFPYRDSNGNEKINLIAVPPGQDPSNKEIDLAFVCHTDTVPYNPAWAEAIQPALRGEFLYGCGACDVKGFLSCLLAALSELKPGSFHRSICIALTADEEVGCVGASKLIDAHAIAPRHVVVGEPTSLQPARAGKGYCLAEIRVHGEEAHSAHPSEGISAIYRAARLILKIEEGGALLTAERYDAFDPPFCTINVGIVRGGLAKNIVPAECSFLLEWRPIPGQDTHQVLGVLDSAVKEIRLNDQTFRHDMVILRDQPGFDAGANSSLVQSLEKMTGNPSIAIPFGTEASLFSRLAEDIVVFGPGDMKTAHSCRECVSNTELTECTLHLRELMGSPSSI
jgi:acetylornithine deacetylase